MELFKDKINSKILYDELLKIGMVYENLPVYINTRDLDNKFVESIKSNIKGSSPITIKMRKRDGGNRIISIPNPVSYQILVRHIFSNKKIFLNILNKIESNEFSFSKVLNKDDLSWNMPFKDLNSNYSQNRREKMKLSVGKRYCLKSDVESFYDNIYSHYLIVGLLGFDQAMDMYNETIKVNEEYKYMSKVDKYMRNMCRKETKGILTGPFTSRIFSELFMSGIDLEISNVLKTKCFRRYVDDIEFFEFSLDKQERNVEVITDIFFKYKLKLKIEKTNIREMPFIDFQSLKELININLFKDKKVVNEYQANQEDLFEALDKAERLSREENSGALKYVFKALSLKKYHYFDKDLTLTSFDSILYLLNYLIVYPQYSNYVYKILENNIIKNKEITQKLNRTLLLFLEKEYDFCSLHLIGLMVKCGIPIKKKILTEYLCKEKNNEILQGVIIAYLCESKKYKYIISSLDKVKRSFIYKGLCDFSTDYWLSKYILFYYDFIDVSEISKNDYFEVFDRYKRENVKFVNFDLLFELED